MKRFWLSFLVLSLVAVGAMVAAHFSRPSVRRWEVRGPEQGAPRDQVVVQFSRPMDRASVEERWSVSPSLPGNISWTEGTLFFTPDEPLPRGTHVQFAVRTGARDLYGRELVQAQEYTYSSSPNALLFLNTDGQITVGQLDGTIKTVTERQTIVDFVASRRGEVFYLHQPGSEEPTQLWRVNLDTKFREQLPLALDRFVTKLFLSSDQQTLFFLTRPLDEAAGQLEGYRFDLEKNEATKLDFGSVEPTLTTFALTADGTAFVLTDLEGVQHLQSVEGGPILSLTKITQYRGSDQAGRRLVFEDIVPDKNYASEIVLFDGVQMRLSVGQNNASMPSLSPGGSMVAYSSVPQGSGIAVAAGQSVTEALSFPLQSLHVQRTKETQPLWQVPGEEMSYELPQFSPDGRLVVMEAFSPSQLRDLRAIRLYGEPNKPLYSTVRFLDTQTGSLLPLTVFGREAQWLP